MTVTKQQQLEWLAKSHKEWPFILDYICMGSESVGDVSYAVGSHRIAKQEWQQERDKMSKTPDVTISNQTSATIAATQTGVSEMTITAQDNSWHERGEFPHVGAICEMIDDKNTWLECEIISHKDGACIGWISSRKAPFYTYDKSEFRPLRTEREKAIDEMIKVAHSAGCFVSADSMASLYDAGYRKEQAK